MKKITDDSKAFEGHLKDLAERSYSNNIYTFTNFLGEAEKNILFRLSGELSYAGVSTYGGMEYAERVIAGFGREEELGYSKDYPISCLRIAPLSQKFSQELGHRDFLGSLMALGIERELLGDIIVKDNNAYLFCVDHIAQFICDNLTQVRHTNVTVSAAAQVPEDAKPDFRDLCVIVSSVRLDAVISKVFSLSRTQGQNLFSSGKVFVNGAECKSSSYAPKDQDIISVRGFGKFIFAGQQGATGKGRIRVLARLFS